VVAIGVVVTRLWAGLEQWRDFVVLTDPDIFTGYNIARTAGLG
jgi:hypothetical protein